jgi:hypothetical protein
MQLQRYSLRNSPYCPGYLNEDEEGEWVKLEDVIKLLSEHTERMGKILENVNDKHNF